MQNPTTIASTDPRLGNRTHPWVVHGRETDIACETLEGALDAAKKRGITAVRIRAHKSDRGHAGLCAKYDIELL